MKKLLLIIALMSGISHSWAYSFSAEAPSGQTLYYNIVSHIPCQCAVVRNARDLPTGQLVIPSAVEYNGQSYTVVSLNNVSSFGAFQEATGLTSVTIPESVTTIGDRAFSDCTNLTSVNIPSRVTTIGVAAFNNCKYLTSVTIPNSVTSIGNEAFQYCVRLTSMTIPNSVTSIGPNAFKGCTSLTSVTIPNSVTTIANYTFYGCTGLTSVTIPNSVTTIGTEAFNNCSTLTSIVIPESVTNIDYRAFFRCFALKTVYNLSGLSIAKDVSDPGYVAYYAYRVIDNTVYTKSGLGKNTLYQITNNNYTIVDGESSVETEIPKSTIPDNFIYKVDNGAKTDIWKAKNIVLVDDTCRFFSPVAFTADQVTYTRDLTDGNRSTLCLPFDADKPAGLDVYTFAGFGNSTETSAGTIRFQELQGNELTAYTPYLVGKNLSKSTTNFTFSKQDADFPATPTPITTSTINGLTFHGTMRRECMNSTNYGYKDGYFVQSSAGTQGDHTSHAHVNPFRCYFTLSGSQNAPATLSVDTDGDYLGIDEVEDGMEQPAIRYSNDVYDMMGRLVRKDADNLRGLPRGIYIWRGKKQIAY